MPLFGSSRSTIPARRTAHGFVPVAIRPVDLRQLTAIVEIRFGGITKRPSAGAAGKGHRRYQFFPARPSNWILQLVLDLRYRRPDKILLKGLRAVQRFKLLAHLLPLIWLQPIRIRGVMLAR